MGVPRARATHETAIITATARRHNERGPPAGIFDYFCRGQFPFKQRLPRSLPFNIRYSFSGETTSGGRGAGTTTGRLLYIEDLAGGG